MNAKLVCLIILIHMDNTLGEETYRFDKPDYLNPAPDDLQYAFIIFRHGIRSPINSIFPNEKYAAKWPQGKGSLTEDGKRLMVHVGQSLKTRYKHLIPDYDDSSVVVTSTLSPRATMSAECVASGMFPPEVKILDDIPLWQPVPVWHTAGYDKHHLFDEVEGKTKCARYVKFKDAVIKEENDKFKLRRINGLNRELKKSQIKPITSMEELFDVWDSAFMEELSLKPSEPWAKKYMPIMTRLAKFRLWSRMHGKLDGDTSILQYFTGPLFTQLINEIAHQFGKCLYQTLVTGDYSKMENGKPCVHLHLHGSHDLTVGAMVWALAKKEEFMAYPGDALILEGYEDSMIQLFHYSPLKPVKERFTRLSLRPLCKQDPCRLSQLKAGIKDLTLTEEQWRNKCDDLQNTENSKWRTVPKIP